MEARDILPATSLLTDNVRIDTLPVQTLSLPQPCSGRSSRSASVVSLSAAESKFTSSGNSVAKEKDQSPGKEKDQSPTKDVKPWRAFLRSVGLKFLADPSLTFKPAFSRIRNVLPTYSKDPEQVRPLKEEQPKVIVSQSRRVALARAGVHLFPIVLTAFVCTLNFHELLNGPPITANATFALQVAAKFHELTIVGSLTAIALDLVQYHLLNSGLSLGLLSAGLTVASPSWMWSIDFISGAKTSLPKLQKLTFKISSIGLLLHKFILSKVFLFTVLIAFTMLATTVGPASAVLFVPTQIWRLGAHSHFVIKGASDDLWPKVLGARHTGPSLCSQSPLRIDVFACLNGQWRNLAGLASYLSPIRPGSSFFIPGGSAWQNPPAQIMSISIRDPDTWVIAPHLSVASGMDMLRLVVDQAWKFSGTPIRWQRRLRDFGGSRLDITSDGKFPITRVVCGNRTRVMDSTSRLDLPILNTTRYWRNDKEKAANITFSDLGLSGWDALRTNITTDHQSRARYVPLPKDLGTASAVLVHLVQNRTTTYALTCAVDARWATGQTMQSDRSMMWSWESQPGYQDFSTTDSPGDWSFNRRVDMLSSRYRDFYSDPVQVEQVWLDALTPNMPEASSIGNPLVMNSFEALLNQSGLPRIERIEEDANDNHFGPASLLEYVTALHFTNALSRVGLVHQLATPDGTGINKELLNTAPTDDSFISGTELSFPNITAPYTRAYFKEYKYGTAWAMADTGQYLSLALLLLHVLIAFIHTIVVVATGRSSASWDSINELVVLAYNSVAGKNDLVNCGGGIEFSRTLERKVRVGTRLGDDGAEKVELVVCEGQDGAGGDEAEEGAGDVVVEKAYG